MADEFINELLSQGYYITTYNDEPTLSIRLPTDMDTYLYRAKKILSKDFERIKVELMFCKEQFDLMREYSQPKYEYWWFDPRKYIRYIIL